MPSLRCSFAALLLVTACDVNVDDGSVASKPLPSPDTLGDGGGSSQVGGGGGGVQGGNGSTGGGTSTGGNGQGACDGGGPVIETAGNNSRYLLKGTVITPAGPLAGQVLLDGNTIACVAASCENDPKAANATVIDTNGVIAPGMLDSHNHILFDVFDEDDWSPPACSTSSECNGGTCMGVCVYKNHNQWPNDTRYGAMVDAKQWLEGQGASTVSLGCELDKYGETKALIAGTTAVQGSPGATNKSCYQSVARTIDQTYNGLPADKMQTATVFPSTSSADGVCTNFVDGDTTAYVVHVGEGIDTTAKNEFTTLNTVTTTDGCLYDPKTTVVHGAALDTTQLATMGAEGMNLVWSPRSNIFLYGAGTDFTKTANIPVAIQNNITIAIAPDWSIGGSQNMLDELRFADEVDNAQFGDILSSADLVKMGTENAAIALGVEPYLGTIEVGKRADIAVYLPTEADPYDSILAATPREVTLVFVDGRLLYGDGDLSSATANNAIPETVDICCRQKFLAIAQSGGNPNDLLDQTLGEMTTSLNQALSDYDAMNLTQFVFAPITPIVKCP